MIKNLLLEYESAVVKNNLRMRSLFGFVSKKEAIDAVNYVEKFAQQQFHYAKKQKQYFRFEENGLTVNTIMDTKNGAVLKNEKYLDKNKYYQVDLKDGKYRRTEFDEKGLRTKTITNIHGDVITMEYKNPQNSFLNQETKKQETNLSHYTSPSSESQNNAADDGLNRIFQNIIIASI